MIYLKHIKAKTATSVLKDGEQINFLNSDLISCFWEICEKFPDELIIWIDEEIDIEPSDDLHNVFLHDLIMASYPIKSKFFPDSIGYIDQFPFVNPDYSVRYPTWLMSTDVGGIKSRIALEFRFTFNEINKFGYLINSIAKLGQQNSLFCYSDPNLIKGHFSANLSSKASITDLFNFVAQHYKQQWLFILFFCLIKYEKQFPFWAFFKSLSKKSWFNKQIDLREIFAMVKKAEEIEKNGNTVDVIIPTFGRPEFLRQVLLDLKAQSYLPSRVIIVEQNPDLQSKTELDFLQSEIWPFEIIHHFIHRTGACNARNLAMKSIKGDWVFFADDDIRLGNNLIEKALNELFVLKINCINFNCIQPGEDTFFNKVKQWAAFGSGTSIVRSSYALKCQYSKSLEFGFGEDIDFGMQLRSHGCDIIYHPDLKMTHLKAERGGFRNYIKVTSDSSIDLVPKPSPTMMWLVKKYYSPQMLKGYKVSLFLKFYNKQEIKNPLRFIRIMKTRWKLSDELSEKLSQIH